MRYFLCAVLVGSSFFAEAESSIPQASNTGNGSFYVNGIVYQYIARADYTVVAAAHSVINHRFVAVKVRVYNVGRQSVTVKPEEVNVEDTVAGQTMVMVSGAELARRMRRPYNWARLAVNPAAGAATDTPVTSDMMNPQMNPQLLEMMRAMAGKANAPAAPILPGNRSLLYTDMPGALQSRGPIPAPKDCDTVCRLRNRETANPDVLAQLQRPSSPDYVEQSAFLANTITPQSDTDGVLYFPMPKLARGVPLATGEKKAGMVQVTVPVGNEKFQFMLVVE